MKLFVLVLILSVCASLSLACGPSAAPTSISTAASPTATPASGQLPTPVPATVIPSKTPGPPTATATPLPVKEWELEAVDIDGSTVIVSIRVFAGLEINVTLDGTPPETVSGPPPVLEYVFTGVAPGNHTLNVSDLIGYKETREIRVSVPTMDSGLPVWLKQLISDLESQPPANPPLSITRYEYLGETVYFQTETCCDIFSNLYGPEGQLIGHPSGGITGRGDGRTPDFFQERQQESLIWRDARKGPAKSGSPVLAPIDNLDLQIAESFPLQYFLLVGSGLPDGCHSFGGYTITRDGNRVLIKVFNLRPADSNLMCIQVYGTVESNIPLGSDYDAGETYIVDVNGQTISFRGDQIVKEEAMPMPTPPERSSSGY